MSRSLRAAVIAEWRGLPERKMRTDRWKLPAELVPKMMQRLGLRERLYETEVIDAWSKIDRLRLDGIKRRKLPISSCSGSGPEQGHKSAGRRTAYIQ
jgi:hypothetical protein